VTKAPPPLVARYTEDDLELFFDDEERRRFVKRPPDPGLIAWQLLYRKEPELYARLIEGEHIAPAVLDALPDADVVVEVAAGTGRLTRYLAGRYPRVVAVEPAAPMCELLKRERLANVDVRRGFFDAIPVADDYADLVVACSAWISDPAHGGDPGVHEMERVARSGGTVAFVWPADVDRLRDLGFEYECFDVDMEVEFSSLEDALELARIFYPDAVEEIERRGSASVPYAVLGVNHPPRDWAWKRVP
jgi:SAM-dependent methyltransferase